MTDFFIYLFRVVICSALFAGCYWFFLRNERFFQWNRFYIAASVILSIIVPALNIPISSAYIVTPTTTYFANELIIAANSPLTTGASHISWSWYAFMLFTSIAFFLFVKEVFSFIRILRLKRRSERIITPEIDLYCTDDESAPFTFFRSIFWKKGISVDSGEGRCILRHELAHVRLGHSWDKALMQLVCCLFWMNPFFMLFRRELELVHEFAADSESNPEELSSLILCTLYPNHYRDFISRFFQSPIKRRIFMNTKSKKSSLTMLRKMSIIPVALFALYLFSCKNTAKVARSDVELTQVKADITENIVSDPIMYAVVDVKPLFNGKNAEEEFRIFVAENTVYPPEAQEKEITGRVFIEFVIDVDGTVTDVRLGRGVDPLLDEEALRVISMSPKWTPGKHEGKPVKVSYTFPIHFRLNK